MLDFFNDIDDAANCLDAFSLTDYTENKVPYSYDVNSIWSNLTLGSLISDRVQGTEFNLKLYGYNRM